MFAGGLIQIKADVNLDQKVKKTIGHRVESAYLTLRRAQVNKSVAESITGQDNIGSNMVLLLYEVLPGNMSRLVNSLVISLARQQSTISIDIRETASNWLNEQYDNHRVLEIRAVDTLPVNQVIDTSSDYQFTPTLDICTSDVNDIKSRRKRSAGNGKVCSPKKCCRKAVEIKLSDIGLHIDDIHEPGESFTAYVCQGKCRKNHKLYNNWSNIKNMLFRKTKDRIYRNKCSPVSYEKAFRIFHIDQHGMVTYSEFDDIIVKQCACT